MVARLTWNKAQLVNSLVNPGVPQINTSVMQQYNPSYNPNSGVGVSGITGTGATSNDALYYNAMQTQTPEQTAWTWPSNQTPIVKQASDINASAVAGAKEFTAWTSAALGAGTTPQISTTGVNANENAIGKKLGQVYNTTTGQFEAPNTTPNGWTPNDTTNPPPSIYDTQRNQAYNEYASGVKPTTQTQTEINTAREQLGQAYTPTQTIEQVYNAQREAKWVWAVEQRLSDTNALIRTNQEGARNAQEQNFSSSGGVTEAGVQQLRAYNSRDFIRNLSDLSNVRANTVDELNMKNNQIDAIVKLRQSDRAQQQSDLKAKIELLSDKISPEEKALYLAKLNGKIASINTKEAAEVDRIKTINEMKLKQQYTLPEYDYKPIQKTDANGNLVTTGYMAVNKNNPQDYKMMGIDSNGQPAGGWTGGIGAQITTGGAGGFQENMTVTRTGNNVGSDTNNPGNITADSIPAERRVAYGQSIGATGTYTSPNGRTYYVFPDMNTGLSASVKDISSKIAGGSSWATPQTTLSDFVKGWTKWPNATGWPDAGYLAQVMKATGANANTPIGQINPTLLAQGVANGEGVNVTKNANIASTVPSTTTQSIWFDMTQAEKYKNALSGQYPTGMKPGSQNAQKLDTEAKAWAQFQKSGNADISMLSTGAKRALESKNVTETGKERTAVLDELQNAGVFDKWSGNQNFYTAPPDKKAEIPSLITAQDRFNTAKSIIDKYTKNWDLKDLLWSIDAPAARLWNKLWAIGISEYDKQKSKDFATLDQIFGKELSQYMNQISGATVGDKEVERLKRQVPNMDMSEIEFKNAFDAYGDSLKNAQDYMLNNYGFNDINTLKKTVWIKPTTQMSKL